MQLNEKVEPTGSDFFSIIAAGLVSTGFMQLIAGLVVHLDFAPRPGRLYLGQALFLDLACS